MTRIIKLAALVCAAAMSLSITVCAQTNVDVSPPPEVEIVCDKIGEQYGISPELLEAICYNESRYTPDALNDTCKGIMQINEPYHTDRIKRLGVTDIYDLESNVLLGADYLAELFEAYEDVQIVLGLYHGESKAVRNAKDGKPSKYVRTILSKVEELERLHDK